MVTDKIEKGILIRDKIFEGNIYAQFGLIMEGLHALNILRKEDATEEEKLSAESKMEKLETLFETIQQMREY